MEMVDFQHYAESFSSPRPVRRQRNSVSNNSFSNLFGEGLLDLECDDYAILEDMAGSSDSDSDDEVIDIEAIDELGSIMASPDKQSTFSSARTAPRSAPVSHRRASVPSETAIQLTGQDKMMSPDKSAKRQVSAPSIPRVRHDSEQMINDLVALEGTVSSCALPSPSKLMSLPENEELITAVPSLEQIEIEDTLASQHLNKGDFSLLGIEGIEAEDLESLFEQFEGATESSPEKPKILSPIRVAKPKPRPRPLTLEDYRRLRGSKSQTSSNTAKPGEILVPSTSVITKLNATVDLPKPVSTIPTKSVPTSLLKPHAGHKTGPVVHKGVVPHKGKVVPNRQQLSVSIPVMQGGAKTAVLSIPAAPWSDGAHVMSMSSTTSATTVLLQNILDDHDYCNTGEQSKASSKPRPADYNASSPNKAPRASQQRDIKAELTMLLQKLPEYIAAVSSTNLQSSQQTDSYNRSLVSPSSNLNGEVVREEIVNTGAQQSVPNSIISQSQPSQCGCDSKAETKKQISEVSSGQVQNEQGKGLPRAYAKPFGTTSRGRGRSKKRKYRKRQRAPSPDSSSSYSSSSSSSEESSDDRSCARSHDRRDSFSGSDSSSLYESYSSDESMTRCSSSNKRKYQMSRKSRRKTPSNRRSRKSSPSQSSCAGRGRHKVRPEAKKRRRHKSGRSSQSVSPYTSSTSSRSPSPAPSRDGSVERRRQAAAQAHQIAMSERRVVYVGGISEKYTKADLRKRFAGFGEIESVATFLRENSENYGFVTFYSKADAYAAIEKGNDVYGPKFNLGFGGRRMFCDTDYADLDGCQAVKEEWAPSARSRKTDEDDFDALLKRSMKKIKS